MKTVFIYIGPGVSKRSSNQVAVTLSDFLPSKYKVKTISAKEVITTQWQKEAALFVMPGGADVPYCKSLNGLGNNKIREYVLCGGNYLGICAGAYYASSAIAFAKETPIEVIGERELKFFPGQSVGPAIAPYDYNSFAGAAVIPVIVNTVALRRKDPCYTFYNGGGYFEDAEDYQTVRTLARYSKINKAAVVACAVGKGQAVLSGVHFEYRPSAFNDSNAEELMLKNELQNNLGSIKDLTTIILKSFKL